MTFRMDDEIWGFAGVGVKERGRGGEGGRERSSIGSRKGETVRREEEMQRKG